MAEPQIRFDDGAAYERMMGRWSRLAGEVFLDWVAPKRGQRWIDVGCGNGAFTELIIERCAPAEVVGVDPSEAQLKFARTRPGVAAASFKQGDAMMLPVAAQTFDVAVMALVIFFVPDPGKGVAEMMRVLAPGGIAVAYAWDILGGGLPSEPVQAEVRAMGLRTVWPPSAEASKIEALRKLWSDAGFVDIETREIVAIRTFVDFEDLWSTSLLHTALKSTIEELKPADAAYLQERVRARLPANADGSISYSARANAVKGAKPA